MTSTSKTEKIPEEKAPRNENMTEPPGDVPAYIKPEKELFAWRAASRPFKKRGREYWITVISVASLLAFILFLAEGVMPVILTASLVFLYYIMSTVSPEEVDYKITSRGIKIADKVTPWDSLTQFWFGKRMDNDILAVETPTFPFRLELIIFQKDIPKIKQTLLAFIQEESTIPTYLDKAVDWMAKKIPSN